MNLVQRYYNQLEREQVTTAQRIQQVEDNKNVGDVVDQQILQGSYVKLNKIMSALARCESGDYGICVSCNEAIDVERLLLVPYADMCVNCQRAEEKRPFCYCTGR